MTDRVQASAARKLGNRRSGFTLLELLLALALTVVILGAISMAVDLHLRSFDDRRNYLEQSQLAHAILRIIADDIRSVVQQYEQDMSAASSLIEAAAGSQTDFGGAASDQDNADTLGGDAGDAMGGELDLDASMTGDDLLGETSENTSELASNVLIPTQPGIYGNQYQLQLDVSRLPRIDELQGYAMGQMPGELIDIPSDIKTVTYYVMSGESSSGDSAVTTPLSDIDDPNVVRRGLVRRQLDRAVSQWALESGGMVGLDQAGEVLAEEVVGIEFLYFDGFEFRTEWDTEAEGGLPLAIEVLLMIAPSGSVPATDVTSLGSMEEPLDTIQYYRLMVHLPTSNAAEETDSDMMLLGL
jgi:prepilin-type N-terminal cleavage/methylation domain-containing protein